MLTHILKLGWLDVADVQRALIRGGFLTEIDEASFFAAAGVIIDYVQFNGAHLQGGAGLPDVKP